MESQAAAGKTLGGLRMEAAMNAPGSLADSLQAQVAMLQRFRQTHPYKTADVGGARWRYLVVGRGEHALLFLPGAFLRADMWFYSILALEDRFRILAPDSFALQDEATGVDAAQASVRLMQAESIPKATAIGLSAGGGVAQMLVQAHPERVDHLVLSHCGVLESDPAVEARLRKFYTLARILPVTLVRTFLLRRTSGRIPASSRWRSFTETYFRQAASAIDKHVVLRFLGQGLQVRQGTRMRAGTPARWQGQVLLLSSKDDAITYPSLEKHQAHYPQARTHVFDEGGHHTFMLFPETYTAVLAGFLDEVAR